MSLVWAIVILVAANAAAIAAMLVVRWRARSRRSFYRSPFAASLFFAGISTRLRSPTSRMAVLGLGYTLFLGCVIWLATFPVSLSV